MENNNSYLSLGTPEEPSISNSSLSAINPEEGGSIVDFRNFFKDVKEEKETKALDNGKLVHLYKENPKEFAVMDITKPVPQMAQVAEYVAQQMNLPEDDQPTEEDAILHLWRTGEVAKGIKDQNKFLEKVDKEAKEYMNFLIEVGSGIVLTPAEKTQLQGCITSLETNYEIAQRLKLGIYADQEYDEEVIIYKEEPITWSEVTPEGRNFYFKSLIDDMRIFPDIKLIEVTDLKTTGFPLPYFQRSVRKYKYYRQEAFYRKAIKIFLMRKYDISATEAEEWNIDFTFAVVKSTGNFDSALLRLNTKWVLEGRKEIASLVKRVKWHYINQEFESSYEKKMSTDGIIEIDYVPKYEDIIRKIGNTQ